MSTQEEGEYKAALQSASLAPPRLEEPELVPTAPSHDNLLCEGDDSLDRPRHHGRSVSSHDISKAVFARVASMGCNLAIREGEPGFSIASEEEELIREKKKVFTDFHNMGVDSASAYLGDDPSMHKNSMFLSSMAYPAGSAGGKGDMI